jgi:hypothetical protein
LEPLSVSVPGTKTTASRALLGKIRVGFDGPSVAPSKPKFAVHGKFPANFIRRTQESVGQRPNGHIGVFRKRGVKEVPGSWTKVPWWLRTPGRTENSKDLLFAPFSGGTGGSYPGLSPLQRTWFFSSRGFQPAGAYRDILTTVLQCTSFYLILST